MASASCGPIPEDSGNAIRYSNQDRPQQQRRAGMNLAKDQKLHDQIHKDRDGDQITYGCECATEHLPPMLSVEG